MAILSYEIIHDIGDDMAILSYEFIHDIGNDNNYSRRLSGSIGLYKCKQIICCWKQNTYMLNIDILRNQSLMYRVQNVNVHFRIPLIVTGLTGMADYKPSMKRITNFHVTKSSFNQPLKSGLSVA